jgi:hypothetical protein
MMFLFSNARLPERWAGFTGIATAGNVKHWVNSEKRFAYNIAAWPPIGGRAVIAGECRGYGVLS